MALAPLICLFEAASSQLVSSLAHFYLHVGARTQHNRSLGSFILNNIRIVQAANNSADLGIDVGDAFGDLRVPDEDCNVESWVAAGQLLEDLAANVASGTRAAHAS